MPCEVVNKRSAAYDQYIGRGSKWGNPYIIGKDGDRETVIRKYAVYLENTPELQDAIPELIGKRLGCFCAPKACHGDVLKAYADRLEKSFTPVRLIIAGGRDFNDYTLMEKHFKDFMESYQNDEVTIISGMAKGADYMGTIIANDYNLELIQMPADWESYGRSAGYLRNQAMADIATHLLAFHDGDSRGTGHMIQIAEKKGLVIKVIPY